MGSEVINWYWIVNIEIIKLIIFKICSKLKKLETKSTKPDSPLLIYAWQRKIGEVLIAELNRGGSKMWSTDHADDRLVTRSNVKDKITYTT